MACSSQTHERLRSDVVIPITATPPREGAHKKHITPRAGEASAERLLALGTCSDGLAVDGGAGLADAYLPSYRCRGLADQL